MKKIEIIKELEKLIEEVEFIIRDSMKQLEVLQECLKNISTLEYPKSFEPEYPKSFKSHNDLEKWLNENGIEFKWGYTFDHGDWMYVDLQLFEHLIRNGVELTKGVKAKHVVSFDNGNWQYYDEQGNLHKLDKNNNEIK